MSASYEIVAKHEDREYVLAGHGNHVRYHLLAEDELPVCGACLHEEKPIVFHVREIAERLLGLIAA